MRKLLVLLSLLLTACGGAYPMRIRPGSNMALPQDRGIVADLIETVVCDRQRLQTGIAKQCLMGADTLEAPTPPPSPPAPAKRP
jgi:hypothetical protein